MPNRETYGIRTCKLILPAVYLGISKDQCADLTSPSMLTYSGWDQPAIASYGPENVAFLYEVQAAYDPTHVFQRLVPGGQKLPEPGS